MKEKSNVCANEANLQTTFVLDYIFGNKGSINSSNLFFVLFLLCVCSNRNQIMRILDDDEEEKKAVYLLLFNLLPGIFLQIHAN